MYILGFFYIEGGVGAALIPEFRCEMIIFLQKPCQIWCIPENMSYIMSN